MTNIFKKLQTGSSLIEVLIAAGVVGVVLTAMALGLTFSVKTSSEAKYRSIAAKQAEEGMELFNKERVIQGWTDFHTLAGTYCLTGANDIVSGACTAAQRITLSKMDFTRQAQVDNTDPDKVVITLTVTWENHHVTVTKEFRDW
ncbi:MAG: hypothetical protein PVJ09_00965 [Candidatus Woesebacteria bacterium]|jgi:Tfp pilus assembly protein PilV